MITNMTDLASTEFSTTLDANITIPANQTVSFNFTYTPVDIVNDSVAFIIETNDGNADTIILKGSAYELPPCIVEIGADNITGQHLPIEPFYNYSYSQTF
jgi:hypothetical protein